MRFTDKTEGALVLMAWPLAKHVLTAGWTYNDGSLHRAIDLRAETGTPVYAAEPGTVDWVQAWDGHSTRGDQSYGNIVRIRHADYKGKSLKTYYAHLSRILVKSGQSVTEGQLIGYSGNTGHSTGPHLHFEVRLGGNRSNPLSWLDGDFTCADDKIRAHLGSYTSVRRPDTALAAGAELHLTRCPLYVSSVAVSSAGTVTGTYYAWSAEVADGRVRITNRADRVGVSGQVTGWIDAAMAGVQTRPAADKPSGCTLTIGPVSAGDRATLRSKCQELQLDAMGLYKETESDGLYTLTVGPITSGDVATLRALCEQLDLVSRGLCREG